MIYNFKSLFTQDKKAKSRSFYLKRLPVLIDKNFYNYLSNYSKRNNNIDFRICLHKNPKDLHHDMILVQHSKNFYPPHKHLLKGETINLIKGKLAIFLFNSNGSIKSVFKLNKGDIFRIPINTFHYIMPVSKEVIYHENINGPFLGDNNNVFPKWAENIKSIKNKNKFLIKLKKML